jgi:phosphoglycerate dehydrogenase-like enzyme
VDGILGRILTENGLKVTYEPEITPAQLSEEIARFDIVIVRSRTKLTKDLIGRASRCKIIARVGVGLDNVDLDAAKAGGIRVINAAEGATTAVAELVLGLMLGLARQVPRMDRAMRNGQWLKKQAAGSELKGKYLGIVGLGNIGKIARFDIVIVRSRTKLTKDLIGRAGRCKIIARVGVGLDNVDLDAAKAGGIRVINAAEGATTAVAELVLGLMLGLARQVPRMDRAMRNGQWLKKQAAGSELKGKYLGIVGLGNIGKIARFDIVNSAEQNQAHKGSDRQGQQVQDHRPGRRGP